MATQNEFTAQLRRVTAKFFLYTAISIASFCFLLFLLVQLGIFGKMPKEADLKQIKNNTATDIMSVDNKLLGRYYFENRSNASLSDIPAGFINALVSTEDVRFYKHKGVDARSSLRVLFKSVLLFNRSAGGGSTITQQLAKNIYPRKRLGFLTLPVAKMREIIIAKRIEKYYTKNEILELYLNTVSFGENTFGIETASIIFFGKKPAELKMEESALLVGILKANGNYNPRTKPEAALMRRNTVLSQMVKYKHLSAGEADSLKGLPVKLNYRRLTHNEGPAPYLREQLRHEVTEILKDKKKADGTPYNIYSDGLKIYTTVNYTLQVFAEESVKEHMAQLQELFDKQWKGREAWIKDPGLARQQIKQSDAYKELSAAGYSYNDALVAMHEKRQTRVFSWQGDKDTLISPLDSVLYHFKTLQAGVLAMNPFNGDILAWVGGSGYKYFKYDHVKSKRQAGSTFKPIVYAAALESGASPCRFYANDSIVYTAYNNWAPENSDGKYGGFYSMKGALAKSVNTVSVKILMETGIDSVINLARKMGITSQLPSVPSLALGTGGVSLYEMVVAYCSFMNKGRAINPRLIRRIEDSQGRLVYSDPAHLPGDTVMSSETAETILAMLRGTVDRGTAHNLRNFWKFDCELAGKTGTTQEQADGWFIGMNPHLVMGVWVGGGSPVVRFRGYYGQGSFAAMPIFARFHKKIYSDPLYKYMQSSSFNISADINSKLSCADYSETPVETFFEIIKTNDGIGDFIRRIFGKRKENR
ncbi:MAG: transglycosylase domain-containing protein [Bacteroidales bacterium]|nr:transglycosylase domain-containing protein [Bacteroidales bacterium]